MLNNPKTKLNIFIILVVVLLFCSGCFGFVANNKQSKFKQNIYKNNLDNNVNKYSTTTPKISPSNNSNKIWYKIPELGIELFVNKKYLKFISKNYAYTENDISGIRLYIPDIKECGTFEEINVLPPEWFKTSQDVELAKAGTYKTITLNDKSMVIFRKTYCSELFNQGRLYVLDKQNYKIYKELFNHKFTEDIIVRRIK